MKDWMSRKAEQRVAQQRMAVLLVPRNDELLRELEQKRKDAKQFEAEGNEILSKLDDLEAWTPPAGYEEFKQDLLKGLLDISLKRLAKVGDYEGLDNEAEYIEQRTAEIQAHNVKAHEVNADLDIWLEGLCAESAE